MAADMIARNPSTGKYHLVDSEVYRGHTTGPYTGAAYNTEAEAEAALKGSKKNKK